MKKTRSKLLLLAAILLTAAASVPPPRAEANTCINNTQCIRWFRCCCGECIGPDQVCFCDN